MLEWLLEHRDIIEVVSSILTAVAGVVLTAVALLWARRQARQQTLQELRGALQNFQMAALQDPELLGFILTLRDNDAAAQASPEQRAAAELRLTYFFFSVLNIHRTAFEARRSGLAPRDFMKETLREFCRSFAHHQDFLRGRVLGEYPQPMVAEIEDLWRAHKSQAQKGAT